MAGLWVLAKKKIRCERISASLRADLHLQAVVVDLMSVAIGLATASSLGGDPLALVDRLKDYFKQARDCLSAIGLALIVVADSATQCVSALYIFLGFFFLIPA